MTTVARRNPEDSAKIKAIEEKLLANPEMAKLIDELGTWSSPEKWCFCPFDKTSSMTVSGTGTSPMVRLAHATSRVGSPASMTPAVIIVFVCSRLVSDM